MKIVGFIGSPHKNGNTAWTVNKILEGAKENGAEIDVFYSSETNINPCIACLGCVKSGKCVVNDGMQNIFKSLRNADAVVLGTPIYMGQMSAQAKSFTDRLFSEFSPRFSPHFKEENAGKKMILVFTQGNPDESIFKPYYDYTKSMFKLLEFDVKDMIVVTGTRKNKASESEELHIKMKSAGALLC